MQLAQCARYRARTFRQSLSVDLTELRSNRHHLFHTAPPNGTAASNPMACLTSATCKNNALILTGLYSFQIIAHSEKALSLAHQRLGIPRHTQSEAGRYLRTCLACVRAQQNAPAHTIDSPAIFEPL